MGHGWHCCSSSLTSNSQKWYQHRVGGGGGGSLYLTTTRMNSALGWASDVSHFTVSLIVPGKVRKSQFLKRKASRSGESNLRPSAYQPSALTTRPQAGSRDRHVADFKLYNIQCVAMPSPWSNAIIVRVWVLIVTICGHVGHCFSSHATSKGYRSEKSHRQPFRQKTLHSSPSLLKAKRKWKLPKWLSETCRSATATRR